jgi:capsid protein
VFAESIPEDEQVDTAEGSVELGNGSVVGLAPGESIETVNAGRPNPAFDGFVRSICVPLGAALEVPYELLLKHFTSSYTAARASFVEFWKAIRTRRAWLAQSFCQPIYEEWLAEAVAVGRVTAPGFFSDPAVRAAWSGAAWHGPAQGQINERVEAGAAFDRVSFGFSTMAQETAELTGRSWDQVNRERSRELAKQVQPTSVSGGAAGGEIP